MSEPGKHASEAPPPGSRPRAGVILTINGGSSSIKFALFSCQGEFDPVLGERILTGQVERIGLPGTRLEIRQPGRPTPERRDADASTFDRGAQVVIDLLQERLDGAPLIGIGHRVVHGGLHLLDHQLVSPELIEELRRNQPLDLAHLPREIALIEVFRKAYPSLPQVACFDTAFHRDLPRVAQILPIPREYFDQGVRRFGFHGLSYTFLMGRLAEIAGPRATEGRVILAHLGSGASMAAVRGGKPVETTMAFTPTAGLVMGTRPGDLDPGLLVYLMRAQKMSPDEMDAFISQKCGLIGISQTSSDMRDLVERRATDERAADAVDLFCYQARRFVGSLHAALGGLDTLVFSGGIGEHSSQVRAGICDGLGCLGIEIDPALNSDSRDVISTSASRVMVRVIPTDEEIVIARAVLPFASRR